MPVKLDCQQVGLQLQAIQLQVPRKEALHPQVNVVPAGFGEVGRAQRA